MRSNRKILNDPIYGLIEIPYGILFDLLEHPYYQRLRRINQLGFTQYVYPGATHTRFNHTIGALHLMQKAIRNLQYKGIEISEAEAEAVCIAILLHDIGHGPFSHCLEYHIIKINHEAISIAFMEKLNEEFSGRLSMAIEIFKDIYPKRFLHQLVSSQLDMDRMDYLTRDSFFTGVYEGVIGYDRIIKTLSVHNDELVIEYKGIYSVEKFLIARRLMYWQVYLHKVVICAGEMAIRIMERARYLIQKGAQFAISESLTFFLSHNFQEKDLKKNTNELLEHFANLDDTDILHAMKVFSKHSDFVLSYLSEGLLSRKLFRIILQNDPISEEQKTALEKIVLEKYPITKEELSYLVFSGTEANKAYVIGGNQEIKILLNSGEIHPISEWREHNFPPKEVVKYFIAYPKNIQL